MKRKKTTSIVPLAIMVGAGALSAIVLAQNGKPTSKPPASETKGKEEPAVIQLVKAERKPLTYYTGAVRTDLFGAPAEAPPAPKVAIKLPEPVKTAPPPVVEINPFEDQAYSGTVGMGGEVLALVENKKTREGQYLRLGEGFLGGKVMSITDRSVEINVAGKSYTLAKSDDYKLTPLDKNAEFLNAPPPGAATPQPGAPQPGAGAGMFGGGRPDWRNMTQEQRAQMRQQFMQNLTPEQRDRMQQRRMDRQFNGGGGGRGGGGFGGGFGG